MKLKYYMRTLGIGIIVTALLMGFATTPRVKEDSSPEETQESAVLTDLVAASSEETLVETLEEPIETDAKVSVEETAEEIINVEEVEETEEESVSEMDEIALIGFLISKGDSSVKVSRGLEELGLIKDAKEFDKFLCDNGYDKKISVGTYEIPMGASEEEIAKIIAGR